MAFSIGAEKRENVLIVTVKGYLNLDGGKELRKRINEFIGKGENGFVLDFSEAPLISSSALGQILELVSEVIPNASLRFSFTGLSETNQLSFTTIGLLEHIPDFPNRPEAIHFVKTGE